MRASNFEMAMDTPHGRCEIVFIRNRYDSTPPCPTSVLHVRWLEAKNLEESDKNTLWLLTQIPSIPTILPLI